MRQVLSWDTITHMGLKRSRQLKPLSSEHHQALLLAFQLKKSIAGHAENAGAPRDLPGLLSLVRRFEDSILRAHARSEEELLGRYLPVADTRRLVSEHQELFRLLEAARSARPPEAKASLAAFADLLERHVRWEERELFSRCEEQLDEAALANLGTELEKRLVLAQSEARAARRA